MNHLALGNKLKPSEVAKVKKKLIVGLREIIKNNTRLNKDNIWVYILDLKPSQMIEYGEILPKSGGEKKWFKNLNINLKKKLNKIEIQFFEKINELILFPFFNAFI